MPEELNRIVTDQLSDLLFVPTTTAAENLSREGIPETRVRLVGDVMEDAARFHERLAQPSPEIARVLAQAGKGFWLATIHRAENTDDPSRLASILAALADLSRSRPVVLPLHPRTRARMPQWRAPEGVHVLEPCGYHDMIVLLRECGGVLTDSGGLQKEAYWFGCPCLILRDETEWVELVAGGHARLVGADRGRIVEAAGALKARAPAGPRELFGGGRAGERIVEALALRPSTGEKRAGDRA
jgi:UDP-GlcNAc3NAcA epimerase